MEGNLVSNRQLPLWSLQGKLPLYEVRWQKDLDGFLMLLLVSSFWKLWNKCMIFHQFSSVRSLRRVRLFATHELQHTRPPCPSPTPWVHPNPCPLSQWCHLTISFSVIPFSSCPQSFPASGSFLMSRPFTSRGQIIGASASKAFTLWGRIGASYNPLSLITHSKRNHVGKQLLFQRDA